MAEAKRIKIECGFCLRSNDGLENARCLPCDHAHCLGCLSGNYDINGIVQCPSCR